MPEPTVTEVLNIDNPNAPKKHSAFSVALSLFLLPPVGAYWAWKDRNLHWLLAIYTLVFGILDIITAFGYLALMPTFQAVEKTINGNFNQTSFIFQVVLIVIFGIAQIVLGFWSYKIAKAAGLLTTTWLAILIIIMVLNVLMEILLAGAMFNYSIGPYYQTINSL